MKLRISALLVALFSVLTVSAQETVKLDYIFDHYSTDDGLPHNSIGAIHQDSKGYIWICTWHGLSRFDGGSFVNYTIDDRTGIGIAHNRMLSVEEDVNGYLWITTYDYHLCRFDPATEEFVSIPEGIEGYQNSNFRVTCFHSGRDGNIWVGFQGAGLYMVTPDLRMERILKTGQNSIGTDVSGIYEDSEGTIYVVSELGVATVIDGNPELVSRSSDVRAFCQFGGKVYLGASSDIIVFDVAGLDKPKPKVKVSFDDAGIGKLSSMTVTGTGEEASLYAGFSGGAIACIDTVAMQPSILKHDMGKVRYLFPDSQGLVWIATDREGIWTYNPISRRFKGYRHTRNVTSYYSDTLANVLEKGGLTWVKMNEYGFGWYDRENDRIVPLNNVPEQEDCRFMNGVACFEVDPDGVLWMSTAQRGLERVTFITPRVELIVPPTRSDDRIAASEIRAMCRDSRGNVWVAAKSREIYCYSPDMTSCRRLPEDIGIVYCIYEDRKGNLWFGTKGDGLAKMEIAGDSYRIVRFRHDPSDRHSIGSDNIYSLDQDRFGRLWIGTFGGGLSMLEDLDSDRFLSSSYDFPNYPMDYGERIRYVHCTSDGSMMLATVGGLLWFDPAVAPESITFSSSRSGSEQHRVINNDIIHIFTDVKGKIFLSTFGSGLVTVSNGPDGKSKYETVNTRNGLSSDIVFASVEDDRGDVWMATERGISRWNQSTGAVTNYSRYDGIFPTSFSEATCEKLPDGTILFGTLNNIYRIDPASFHDELSDSRLVISGFEIDGRRVSSAGRVDVPHDYSYFRFDFASLNYSVQDRLNYSYMLKGYDKKWISNTVGQQVTYSRIPPGKYTFTVSVSNPDGHSMAETASMDIRVRSSVWTCTAARILYVLLACTLIFVLLRMFYTSARLRSSIQMEKDLNDVKVRFFTNISHELRTPLTLILGGIDEVSKNTPQGDRNEYAVNLVYKNAKRMMTLVNQLLDIRRIVSGKIRLKVSQFDVVELVRRVYDDFRDMAADRKMEMRLTHSMDSLMVWGDEMRLESLVYNLLSNAFKYTADGGRVEAAVFWREGDDKFTIMVKDNGIGVPKDKQTAIFEPFISASDAAFRGMSSSGIGLSFCKEIAKMHGGRIWVESRKNQGSEFYVELPVERDRFSEETAEFIEKNSQASEGEAYGLGKYKVQPTFPEGAPKVLVVEDNVELRVFVYNNLINRFEVREAGNGSEALDVLSSGWMPDVIVTDMMMPQMDGIELINRVRNDFNTSHIPIIMCTARHEDDTHVKAMKYGADGYIAKPFTMELLLARIDNLLERKRELVANMAATGETSGKEGAGKKVKFVPEEVIITDKDEELIKKVQQWLEDNVADSEITVDQLAVYVGMGRTSMYNKIKGLTGKSPVELIQDFRLEKATYYLKSGQFSVSETSYKVGFSDPGYFSRTFKKHFGMSPADYIKENSAKSKI